MTFELVLSGFWAVSSLTLGNLEESAKEMGVDIVNNIFLYTPYIGGGGGGGGGEEVKNREQERKRDRGERLSLAREKDRWGERLSLYV